MSCSTRPNLVTATIPNKYDESNDDYDKLHYQSKEAWGALLPCGEKKVSQPLLEPFVPLQTKHRIYFRSTCQILQLSDELHATELDDNGKPQ